MLPVCSALKLTSRPATMPTLAPAMVPPVSVTSRPALIVSAPPAMMLAWFDKVV